MENKLISAKALMKAIREFRWFGPPNTLKLMFEYLRLIIRDQPAVDAVEVVRCKDCKHFVEGEPYDPCECMKWNTKYGVTYTTPDGYCHKGERRTDNA